jgi:hypothetical protein
MPQIRRNLGNRLRSSDKESSIGVTSAMYPDVTMSHTLPPERVARNTATKIKVELKTIEAM